MDSLEEVQKTEWGEQRKASCTFDSYKIWFVVRD